MSILKFIKATLKQFLERYRKRRLRKIAEMMAEEYKNDPELIAFTALDGEPFL